MASDPGRVMTILDEIFANKRSEVAQKKREKPFDEVQAEAARSAPALDFVAALRHFSEKAPRAFNPALIAEVKRASPSKGIFREDLDPVHLARLYRRNGAAAISVLTDERYFKGSLEHLRSIRRDFERTAPRVPLLRKDFIFDPYQIYEARAAGADCVLLIAAHLSRIELTQLHSLALELGMTPLVEVHSLPELEMALACEPRLVGINNRDLGDFSVSLDTTMRVSEFVPQEVCLVAESGIHSRKDIDFLAGTKVDAVLVGEALVTAPDVASKVRELAGVDAVA
jgi:indole-3-glycerol phosphate synthase